jgi:hypothetical protein
MFMQLSRERTQIEPPTRRVIDRRQLELERWVGELSTRFIDLPADKGDQPILHALRRIGEALDLDRCTPTGSSPAAL